MTLTIGDTAGTTARRRTNTQAKTPSRSTPTFDDDCDTSGGAEGMKRPARNSTSQGVAAQTVDLPEGGIREARVPSCVEFG
jgi:hypothetical protein